MGEAIDDLKAAGRPTEEARTGWWHKISGPLSTVLMPLLAATAAFGLARSGKVLLRATIGMALGFAYFVADNFSLALGNVRRLSAVPRGLGAVPAVPADRRIRPDPAGRIASACGTGLGQRRIVLAARRADQRRQAAVVGIVNRCESGARFADEPAVRLAQRMIGQRRAAGGEAHDSAARPAPTVPASVAGGGTLTLSRYCSVTLIGSPSFSHRWATRVRTWLRNMTPDATPRKIRKARSGMAPVATRAMSAIAQMLAAASCSASRGANSPSGRLRRNFGLICSPE